MRAAEACADDETHKVLKNKERKTYYIAIYDEDPDIEFPKPVARTATVMSGLDHPQDGQLAPKERFGKVPEVFVWWHCDDKEDAKPIQAWHHEDMRLESPLPFSKEPQDTPDFTSKFVELIRNNMILATAKQDSSADTPDPLLQLCEMFPRQYVDGKSDLEKKAAGMSSDATPATTEPARSARCIVASLHPKPTYPGAGSEDVDWVFYNPQSRGDKKLQDDPGNLKDPNATTKAIWHHTAAGARNDQVPGKGNSAHLWQRSKAAHFQHPALDFQYAELPEALATYFDPVEHSTFRADQEEWFRKKHAELKEIEAKPRSKACEDEFNLCPQAACNIHADVIATAENDLEESKLDDREVPPQLQATQRLSSLVGATEHFPQLKELMSAFSDQDISDQPEAPCTTPPGARSRS